MMYALLCNHHSKDWLRLESSADANSRGGFSEERVSTWPYSLHRLIVRKEPVTMQWGNQITLG